jgi:hypothetical protein
MIKSTYNLLHKYLYKSIYDNRHITNATKYYFIFVPT